jgi:hypothetical protein
MKHYFIQVFLLGCCLSTGLPALAGNGSAPIVNQQQQTVKGTVVDKTGEPLIGVTVTPVGGKGGTITDIDRLHPFFPIMGKLG